MTVYVIADAGSNVVHDYGTACNLISTAAHAGADAYKLQLFRASDLYPLGTAQWEAASAAELDSDWLDALAAECAIQGIDFLCSAFAPWAVDAIDPYVRAHKVASLELTDTELLRHVAAKRKPVILSTGAASAEEVAIARQIIESSWWGAKLCVLQCTAAYPAPIEDLDLAARPQLGSCYWLSDHTMSVSVPSLAVALGASVIEKHLRPAGNPPSPKPPDWDHSLEPSQFAEMVRRIRVAESALGQPVKRVRPSEEPLRPWQHRPGGLRGTSN